ncbi:hypothetical protein A2379_00610 [Candidatus Amesbacteria bacterium RIFOXYB1_FULL_47_13]|nr:MAG: hypothetical protein A2379_00610 [Candidatus Amesbacteria bacterium RIFOXYB1_FULL_47_13]HBC73097.1 hypothetical protein [Candidatus Amesbacteria bacterium]
MQSETQVSFTLLNYSFSNVPLFSVIIGSMLIGVLLAYLIHMINSIPRLPKDIQLQTMRIIQDRFLVGVTAGACREAANLLQAPK